MKHIDLWNCEVISTNRLFMGGDWELFCLEKDDDFGLELVLGSAGEGI